MSFQSCLSFIFVFLFCMEVAAYEPNLAVRAAHNIPRITPSFTTGTNNFDGSSIKSTYVQSLMVFPPHHLCTWHCFCLALLIYIDDSMLLLLL